MISKRKNKEIYYRDRFLYIYGIDFNKWCKKWNLESFSHPCIICGRILTTSIPFAFQQARGITAPKCECGHDGVPYQMTNVQDFDIMGDITQISIEPVRGKVVHFLSPGVQARHKRKHNLVDS